MPRPFLHQQLLCGLGLAACHVLAHAAPALEDLPAISPVVLQVISPDVLPEPMPQFAVLETVQCADARFGAALDSATLGAQRGGTDTVHNTMQLDGSVRDNVANHVVTGSNTIDAGSFAQMSGIPTVIQNSGANVLIQNATIINLQFK